MLGKTINTFKCQLFLFNYTQWKHRLEDSDGAFMTFVTIITNHVSEIMSSEGKVTKQWFLKPWMANKINGQLWGSSTTFAIYTFIYLFFCLFFTQAAATHMKQMSICELMVQGETGSTVEINEASWVLETLCAHYTGVPPRLEHFTLQSNSEVAPVNSIVHCNKRSRVPQRTQSRHKFADET